MVISMSKSFCFLIIFLPLFILSHAQATTGDTGRPECTGETCSHPETSGQPPFYHQATAAPCGFQHPLHPGIPCGPQEYPRPCKGEAGKPASGRMGCRPGDYQQCSGSAPGTFGGYPYPGNLPMWMIPPNMYQQYLSGMQSPFGMAQQCYNYYTGRYEPCNYQNAYSYPQGSGGV